MVRRWPTPERYRKSSGIEVLHDETIDPLRDMDGWLCQVAAMDAVVSIANTTHGSGGLGIPTLCLVSQQSDWRWIDPKVFKVVTGIRRQMPLSRSKRQLETCLT